MGFETGLGIPYKPICRFFPDVSAEAPKPPYNEGVIPPFSARLERERLVSTKESKMFGVACYVSLIGIGAVPFGKAGVDYVADEILIEFKQESSLTQAAILATIGAPAIDVHSGGATLRLPKGVDVGRALAYLMRSGLVASAEPNFIAHAAADVDDPAYPSQYGIVQTFCNAAWEREDGAPNVVVAVLDTGIDRNHAELQGRVLGGYDFVNGDADPADDNGHGTLCAGIIAAEANNGIGIAGVAYSSTLLPVKVLNNKASGDYGKIAQGIRWATDQGVHVISMSLAGSNSSNTLRSALDYANSRGVVVVAAAGNNGNKRRMYPAGYTSVVSVAAVDRRRRRPSYSNYGSWIDVAAPGDAIYSTYPGGTYRTANGTSMASAFVAGEAALLKGYYGTNTSARDITRRIEGSSVRIGSWVRYGLVNILRAMSGSGV